MAGSYVNSKLRSFGTTIFAEMSALATETGSINLGQGFPDTDGPSVVAEAAVEAIRTGRGNQYPPGPGIPELRYAIADHQRAYYGIELDPNTDVLVTAGATEALAAAALGLLEAGDEVIVFEPFYDSYPAAVAMAGASMVPVTLRPPSFGFDEAELRAAVTSRTRLILVNTPHNPTGAVFDRETLAVIARVAIENDLLVLSDEAYEHLTYDGVEHIPISTLPGMAERTITVGSAGKTLSFTGWKVGWATGPAALVSAVRTAKQFLTYVSAGPFQYAVATGLGLGPEYFTSFAADLAMKRDRLAAGLRQAGFEVFQPKGTYFITTDISALTSSDNPDAMSFCRALPHRCGVVAVPNSVFYADPERGRSLVRFAFCKRTEVIDEAVKRLGAMA
jgi:N-succinyldiaminopimelate aminotransferase